MVRLPSLPTLLHFTTKTPTENLLGSENPELKGIYEDANKNIEIWTKRIQFWFVTANIYTLVLAFIATLTIMSYIKYTQGLESFEYTAMFPAW